MIEALTCWCACCRALPPPQCKFEALPSGSFAASPAVPEMPAFLNAVFDSHVAHMSQGPAPGLLGGGALDGGPLAGGPLGGGPLGADALGATPLDAQQRASGALGSGSWAPSGGVDGLGLDFEDDDDCTLGSQDTGSLEGGLHNNRTAGGAGKRLSLAELQAHFNLGLREAAYRLGICPTTLKARACHTPVCCAGGACCPLHGLLVRARACLRAEGRGGSASASVGSLCLPMPAYQPVGS